jgi:DNA-binding MarR family transcriptional regulator
MEAPPETPLATPGQLDGLLGYHLRRASAAMMADFSSELSSVQLRPVQFAILAQIADNDGTSQRELCRELSVQKANMVPLIAELERRGLIAREPAPFDRRVQMLTLTPATIRDMPAWRALAAHHEERFFGVLSGSERALMLKLLRKLWAAEETAAVPDEKGDQAAHGRPSLEPARTLAAARNKGKAMVSTEGR